MAFATTDDATAGAFALPPAPPTHPFRLRRVLGLLRELHRDPTKTELALEVFEAVGGNGGERTLDLFLRQPEAAALLRERPLIAERLADHAWLASLPEGSVGRAHLDFQRAHGFAADGLAETNRNVEREGDVTLDGVRTWFFDRYTICHDLLHVVTGLDTSEDGEALLLAFSHGQTPQRGYLALLAMIAFQTGIDLGFHAKLVGAWRAGRRAAPLVAAPWETLLERPLEAVRRDYRIEGIER